MVVVEGGRAGDTPGTRAGTSTLSPQLPHGHITSRGRSGRTIGSRARGVRARVIPTMRSSRVPEPWTIRNALAIAALGGVGGERSRHGGRPGRTGSAADGHRERLAEHLKDPEPGAAPRRRAGRVCGEAHPRRALRRARGHLRLRPSPTGQVARDAAAPTNFARSCASSASPTTRASSSTTARTGCRRRRASCFTLDYAGLGDRTVAARRRTGSVDARRHTGHQRRAAAGAAGDTVAAAPSSRSSSTPNYVQAHLGTPGVSIVDGRAAGVLRRRAIGREAGERPHSGHIAGAKSVPFTEVTDDTIDAASRPTQLQALFAKAGVQPARHRRRLLPHRPAGDGDAVRRALARPSGAAVRRVVRGLVRNSSIARSSGASAKGKP